MKGLLVGLGVACTAHAVADVPPHVALTTLDGLPSDEVQAAVEDPHGFLWFATSEGLARFDGRSFRVFGPEHGLEDPFLLGLQRDDDGTLWLGAIGGVWRFAPSDGGTFSRVPARTTSPRWEVLAIARGPDGSRWAATNDGLYRLDPKGGAFERVEIGGAPDGEGRDVAFDADGNLWYATTRGVLRRAPDGTTLAVEAGGSSDLLVDRSGFLWIAVEAGAGVVEAPGAVAPRYRALLDGLPAGIFATSLAEDPGGGMWLGSRQGVFRLDPGGSRWRPFEPRHLRGEIDPLCVDTRGGIWLAQRETGIDRWSPAGIRAFGSDDGLEPPHVWSITRDRSGAVLVLTAGHGLHRWDGKGWRSVRLRLPAAIRATGWGWGQTDFRDRDGRWWVATGEGILRYARTAGLEDLARNLPESWWNETDGLPGHDVFRLFEDTAGDVWISVLDVNPAGNLARWVRATGRFETFGEADGLPARSAPTSFAQTRDGTLWVGFYAGQLARRRGDRFEPVEGLGDVRGSVPSLLADRGGRLWVATARGLFRCDDPHAAAPRFTRYGTAEGLGSARIRAVAEDGSGRLFVATGRGVDVLDPSSGTVWPLTLRDGLPRGLAMSLCFDGKDMWFGTTRGLARIDPARVTSTRTPPSPRIDALRVAGAARRLPSTGVAAVEGLVLGADERQLQIDVSTPTVDPAERVRIQYRVGEGPWSVPSDDRSILLANLAPGRARLEIRAMAHDGTPSRDGAFVGFRALAPWWTRPWFLGLIAAALVGSAGLAYRARLKRLVALERQRTRIAMDLHDEIGSGLGSIGLLADLASDASVPEDRRRALADEMGTIASELGGAMGEIVWSLRPGSGTIEGFSRHLVERARRIFPGGGATLVTEMPSEGLAEALSLAVRRHAMLVAVEALHNAARHARAGRVELRVERAGRRWAVSVVDDGRGMEDAGARPGMGLENMRRRAERIGASLEVAQTRGGGTTVRLSFDPAAEETGGPA